MIDEKSLEKIKDKDSKMKIDNAITIINTLNNKMKGDLKKILK